ncbi:MAG: cation transporter [Ignavibacteriae bacterium]|nr:cation transporter [Ignavibacteriota bacterium]
MQTQKLTKKGIKATLVGIFTSLILASIKIISGIIGNSYALIADGIESISDVFTSFVVLTGLKIAAKPADENHPYGHGKAEPLAAAVVAISLFLAAFIIIYQSIHEIITPHHAPAKFTLIVLLLVIFTKEFLFRKIIKIGSSIESTAVKNDAWHHRSDAITSSAAFIGILIAILGGEGYESADDFAALFASLIILYNGYRLLKPTLYELSDANISEKLILDIKNIALQIDQVLEVEKCFVRKMGFDYYVDAHIVLDGNLTVSEGHLIAHKVKDRIINSNPKIREVLIHVEPSEDTKI